MRKAATGRPHRSLERILKRVLVMVVLLNLLLVATVHASYLRLDLIHPSLPAISLVSLRSAGSRFIDDLAQDFKGNTQKIAGLLNQNSDSEFPNTPSGHENLLVGDLSVTPMEDPLNDSTNPWIPTVTHTPTIINEENPTVTPTSIPASTPTSPPPNPTSIVPMSKTYYVAPNGKDSNPGTEKQPWRTIQKAADSMVAGDSVVVLSGEYDERVQITMSGSSGAPITYQTEGTVTMKGFTVRADYIVIEGFEITDTDNHWSDGWGIFVQGSYCILKNNDVYFATRGGISLFGSGTTNCVVKNNRLRRNSQVGIDVQGRNNLIVGNEIWRTIQYHPKWTNPPSWVDADGMRFFGSGHTIRNNYIHDITYDDPENVNPHIDCFQTWGNGAGKDILFEQNYCENLNEGMYAFMLENARNLTIRNNIFQAYGGINTGGGGNRGLTIVNNVFANDLSFQAYPVGVGLENCPNTIVKNNIFYDQPSHTISVTGNRSGQEIDYNLAFRIDGLPSRCYMIDYKCVDPAPAHDLWNVDPLFVNPASGNFHLRGGSPAIDAGISLGVVTNDFDGNLRPQGRRYDIGAYERVK